MNFHLNYTKKKETIFIETRIIFLRFPDDDKYFQISKNSHAEETIAQRRERDKEEHFDESRGV